jgi:hypothetical protein
VSGFFDELGLSEANANAQLESTPSAGFGNVGAAAARPLYDLGGKGFELSGFLILHVAHV